MEFTRYLESKINGDYRSEIAYMVARSISRDVKPLFLQGLENVDEIILANAFTKYGWLLAIYNALGLHLNGALIIYLNKREPRWTASSLIHEVIHVALGVDRKSSLDIVVDEALAYTASFKSGFQELYENGIRDSIELLSKCRNPYNNYDLVSIVVPRILAYRLVYYKYTHLVKQVLVDYNKIFDLWFNARPRPSKSEVQALVYALKAVNMDPGMNIDVCVNECNHVSIGSSKQNYVLEGVDEEYLQMIRLLQKAARNREKAREILAPWWDILEEIKDDVEAYLSAVEEML